ncbi:MAG: phage terminase large subunit [Devosia sp.]|uniref:phage terminase large subunit n=1 Tax=Devosia sp. TaxID=1871048 RepID=UPI001AC20BD5|nr:phage terminase large subunit [Devosia sp.]MBN9315281.1 phage terminase large subunit [Devosia sp.]
MNEVLKHPLPVDDQAAVLEVLLTRRFDAFIAKTFQHLNNDQNLKPNWLLGTMAWHLDQVERVELKRLIINVPPRHLKSISASVAFPAFVLGRNPGTTFTLVCYSQELGEKMMRDLRSVLSSPWFRRAFPELRLTKNTSSEIVTDRNGGVNMTSVEGTLTGRGSDIIIVDDPIKPGDVQSEAERKRVNEWFSNTLFSRLNDKKTGRIVVAMQRLHEDDVTGYLTASPDHGWTVLKVPAIADLDTLHPVIGRPAPYVRAAGSVIDPDREDHETLAQLQRDLGSLVFSAQYQQEPLPREGNLVKTVWFKTYTADDLTLGFDAIVASWDTASAANDNNDFSVGTVWGVKDNRYYLLRVYRERLEYPDLRRLILEVARRHSAGRVLLEKADSGRNLYADLIERDRHNRYRTVTPKGSKEDRLAACSAIIEEGRVYLPESADWMPAFLREITGFPSTRHDDQVDSVSQFLNHMRRQSGGRLKLSPEGRPKLERKRLRPR